MDELKKANTLLYDRFTEIEEGLCKNARSIYLLLQIFFEAFFKQIAQENGIEIDKRSTLGTLITNNSVRKAASKYNVKDLEALRRFNIIGNKYKHDKPFTIHEDTVYYYYDLAVRIIIEYLGAHDLPRPTIDTKQRFQRLVETEAAIEQYRERALTKKDQEIDGLKEQIFKLQKEKNDLEEILNNDTIADSNNMESGAQERRKQYHDLKDRWKKLEQDLESLHEEKAKRPIAQQAEIVDKVNRLKQDRKRVQKEIKQLDMAIKRDQQRMNADFHAVDSDKHRALLEEKDKQIKDLKEAYEKTRHEKASLIAQGHTDYDHRSKLSELVNHANKSIFFASSYREGYAFDITNIDLKTASRSKYKSQYAVLYNLLTRGSNIMVPERLDKKGYREDQLHRIYTLQMLLLLLMRNGTLNDSAWRIDIDNQYKTLLEEAYNEITTWMGILVDLTNAKFSPPKLKIDSNAPMKILYNKEPRNNREFVIREYAYVEDETPLPLWIEDRIDYRIFNDYRHKRHLQTLLKDIFGFTEYLEGQIPIIQNFLNGNNTIGILPTGGGKSLTYYFCVLLQPKASLVIAPLNSLIKDQIRKLHKTFGITKVGNLTSDNKDKARDMQHFKAGRYSFTFASPERLQNRSFRNTLIVLNNDAKLDTIVFDEVHCLSEWGHDFRVPYLMVCETVNTYLRDVFYLGLTATASISVVKDLMIELNIKSHADVVFSKHLKRDNLDFSIHCLNSEYDKAREIQNLISGNIDKESIYNIAPENENTNAGIIFCKTKGRNKEGVSGVRKALAGDYKIRDYIDIFTGDHKESQDAFMDDEKTLLVATKAFGMGVDKPNIRFTIHNGMPSSREAFYQEAGRAGRDGKLAKCHLFTYEIPIPYRDDVKKFLNLDTSVHNLKRIQDRIKWKTDLSTNCFFLVKDMQSPREEASTCMTYFQELTKNRIWQWEEDKNDKENSKNRIESTLYILHKLGIVANWEVFYHGYESVEFTVYRHQHYNDIGHIKRRALHYLALYKANKRDIAKIKQFNDISELPDLITHVRTWYHNTFIRGRREQLANMFAFVQKYKNRENISQTLQQDLDKYFNIENLISNEDRRVDLDFDQDTLYEVVEKAVAVDETELDAVQSNMERLIESYSNEKIDLFMALIHLRQGTFTTQRNGEERFLYVYRKLSAQDTKRLTDAIRDFYGELNVQQRLQLINAVQSIDSSFYLRLLDKNEDCIVLNGILSGVINNKMATIWSDESGL